MHKVQDYDIAQANLKRGGSKEILQLSLFELRPVAPPVRVSLHATGAARWLVIGLHWKIINSVTMQM